MLCPFSGGIDCVGVLTTYLGKAGGYKYCVEAVHVGIVLSKLSTSPQVPVTQWDSRQATWAVDNECGF